MSWALRAFRSGRYLVCLLFCAVFNAGVKCDVRGEVVLLILASFSASVLILAIAWGSPLVWKTPRAAKSGICSAFAKLPRSLE